MNSEFKPGGEKGKLHRELGLPEGEKIPAKRLNAAEHSQDDEVRRDAIRAKTMEHWHHTGPTGAHHRGKNSGSPHHGRSRDGYGR